MKRNYQIVDQNGRGKLSKQDREAFRALFAKNGPGHDRFPLFIFA